MASAGGGGSIGVPSFASSSCLSRKPNVTSTFSLRLSKLISSHRSIGCLAVQETPTTSTSTPTVAAETKEKEEAKTAKEATATATAAAADASPAAKPKPKPKSAAKAPPKPLPQLMDEDVIPSLRAILEAQDDISEIELSFEDNKLEGSFLKKGNPYSFWAFFPGGALTGPKGFSLSSYGSGASTVEPFLVDEKKITAKHVVFWVEKRLAAQGIIPVWRD